MSRRTEGEANFAAPAEVIGNSSRAAMLSALLDGRALPMSVLAAHAGVSASTASEHLGKLTDAGLVACHRSGRYRYYSLASAEVADLLERLSLLAPPRPVRSLKAHSRRQAMRFARSCYDHCAGRFGVALFTGLLDGNILAGGDGLHHRDAGTDRLSAPGRDVDYRLTEQGHEVLARLGVDPPTGPRRLIGYCVDWTEQRHHLSGALGAALLRHFLAADWVRRSAADGVRVLLVTAAGEDAFARHFGVDVAALRGGS